MKTRSIFLLVCVVILSGSVNRQVVDEIRDWPLDISPSFVTWSSDSQWYTFVDVTLDLGTAEEESTPLPPGFGPTLPRPAWGAYSPSTKRYIVDYTWWLQPELSSAEAAVIDTVDLIRSSPDGSRLLFSSPSEALFGSHTESPFTSPDPPFSLHIYDRRTEELIDTLIPTSLERSATQNLIVTWSGNSRAFAVALADSFGSNRRFYFPDPSVDDTLWIDIGDFQLDGKTYRRDIDDEHRLIDITEDGDAVLITALDTSDDALETDLIVWYPLNEVQSYVIPLFDTADVVSGAFVLNSNEQILFVLWDGTINLYDSVQDTTQVIGTIPSTGQLPSSSGAPRFSPDGQWLAYFSDRTDQGLHFLDVTELLAQFSTGEPLRLTSLCSPDPDTVRVWHVSNVNSDPVNFTWKVVDTAQYGSGTVPSGTTDNPGKVTFETQTVLDSSNTVRLFVNGIEQDQQDSSGEVCNQPPTANAGADQTLTADAQGNALVTLDGSASTDSDGTIVSYVWTENGVEIATGATPQVTLSVGTHTITLTVTDDDGAVSTDEVVVTVEEAAN